MSRIFQLIAFRKAALVTTLFASILMFTGCNAQSGPSSVLTGPGSWSDVEFEKGANRPPSPRTLYAMTKLLAARGKDAECEMMLNRIIREHPHFLPAYNSLAESHIRRRHIDDALLTLSTALEVCPRDPVLLNNYGMCWLIRGRAADALEMFTEAAAVVPNNARYRANMAVALGLMGRYDEAASLYSQILPPEQVHHNVAVLRNAKKSG